ncbi:MAG: phosphatidylserine decarboxylase [Bacteroidia bacterium]|nr:phosphatidylserine decarboxylase [Bacteroidia bacterium]
MAIVRFHREGWAWITATMGIGTVGILLALWLRPPAWLGWTLGGLWLVWAALLLNFFRYPKRPCPSEPHLIYAPCDGKVVEVCPTFEPKHFHAEMLQISIFMSPLNVHVNWAPAPGTLRVKEHMSGTYLVAWHPKASLLNEQTFLAVEDTTTERYYALRQIAGILARRISTYPSVGSTLKAGEEIGFIKFGSRVDVLLPLNAQAKVRPGDRVRGALTPIAQW